MSISTSDPSPDSPIRVVVTPSQSSYFAGEPFSVTITFTNTRSPESLPLRSQAQAHTHKRGAHSISSAPLARPPTSPGTPRTSTPPATFRANVNGGKMVITRKGFIGKGSLPPPPPPHLLPKGADELPDVLEQSRKRLLVNAKPLSVNVPFQEVEPGPKTESAAYVSAYEEIIPSFIPPPLPTQKPNQLPFGRSQTLPPNHPHARKHSVVLDGQLQQLLEHQASLSSPYPSSTSTPTFSLSLDPIAESTPSPFSAPGFGSIPTTPSTGTYLNAQQPRRPSHLDHGPSPLHPHPHPGSAASIRPTSATFSQHSNTELILYSYAQLIGTLSITPVPAPPGAGGATTPAAQQAQNTLNSLRSTLMKRSVVGGGSMDITSSLHHHSITGISSRRSPQHRRASSFSSSLLSFISSSSPALSSPSPSMSSLTSLSTPSLLSSSQSWTPSHRGRTHSYSQSQSMLGGFLPSSSSAPGSVSSLANLNANGHVTNPNAMVIDEAMIDPEMPLPTFEVPQVMLAVDLALAPGESRSYTYTLPLPPNLPPTYKGRALKFSYQFVVGTCRAGSASHNPISSSGGSGAGDGKSMGANSVSRVMKVPIRVYNHVFVGRPPKAYDLLWPARHLHAQLTPLQFRATVIEEGGASTKSRRGSNNNNNENNESKMTNGSPKTPPVGRLTATGGGGRGGVAGTYDDLCDYARRLVASFRVPEDPHGSDGGGGNRPGSVKEVISPMGSEVDLEEEGGVEAEEEEGTLSGCREAVEILTRNPKKVSYDVNKDDVKVAVLTFTKSAYRLGETVLGVVELNERGSRARVLSLSAILETHETLPTSISSPSSASTARQMRRVHAEHHSSFVLSSLRTTFALDIPSDASPAFNVQIGDSPHSSLDKGGLEWKVRLCLLVAVANERSVVGYGGERMKQLVKDGVRGQWGSSWKACAGIEPLQRLEKRVDKKDGEGGKQGQTWGQYFVSSILGTGDEDEEDEDEEMEGDRGRWDGYEFGDGDGEEQKDFGGGSRGWRTVGVETVECEVGIKVWPGNTAFKAMEVIFDV